MATQPRKRPGRPARELEPGERVPMSFRVRPELKNRMDAAAAESGRSVAQEIELRLEQSFLIERLIETRLIDVMREFDRAGSTFAREQEIEGDWTQDPGAYHLALHSAIAKLVEAVPGLWDGKLTHAIVEQAFVTAQTRRLRGAAGGLLPGEGFITPKGEQQ